MEYRYTAFISYKHAPVDMAAAERVQNYLEHFHISREMQKSLNRKEIGRIFRDKTETAATADLNDDIMAALRQSQFLIVICSPETRTSTWVEREIATFLETNPRDRVITVLAGGEPTEVIPELLLEEQRQVTDENGDTKSVTVRLEPLSCDLRGNRRQQMREELPRLAAVILGCRYDELRQRMRIYRLHRLIAASVAALALILVFLGYAVNRAVTISKQAEIISSQADNLEQQNARLEEQTLEIAAEYLQAQKNQARYLASISDNLYRQGYRDNALLTATAILPEDTSGGPLIPEQMYALNQALCSYNTDYLIYMQPAGQCRAEKVTSGRLSADETKFLAIEDSRTLVVLDVETGDDLWRVTLEDIQEAIDSQGLYYPFDESFGKIADCICVDGTEILICLPRCLILADYEKKAITGSIPLEIGFSRNNCVVSGRRAAVWNNDTISIFDLESLDASNTLHFDEQGTAQAKYTVNDVSFSPDGRSLAIGLSAEFDTDEFGYEWDRTPEDEAAYQEALRAWKASVNPIGLAIWEPETGQLSSLTTDMCRYVCFVDDTHVGAVHFRDTGKKDNWGGTYKSFWTSCYNPVDGSVVFTEEERSTNSDAVGLRVLDLAPEDNGEEVRVLVAWTEGEISIILPQNGEIRGHRRYTGEIKDVFRCDKSRVILGLSNGKIHVANLRNSGAGRDMGTISPFELPSNTSYIFFHSTSMNTSLILQDGDVLLYRSVTDPDGRAMSIQDSVSTEDGINGVVSFQTAGGRYLCVTTGDYSECSQILIYPPDSGECCCTFKSTDGKIIKNSIRIADCSGQAVIAYVENTDDSERSQFCKYSIPDGKRLCVYDLSEVGHLYSNSVVFSDDLQKMYVKRSLRGIIPFDISGDTVVPANRALLSKTQVNEIALTRSGRFLIAVSTPYSDPNRLFLIDTVTGEETVSILPDDLDSYQLNLSVGNSKDVCAMNVNGTIKVIDCASGDTLSEFPCDGSGSFAFFEDDAYLITAYNDNLSMYEISTGRLTYTCAINDTMSGTPTVYTEAGSSYFALQYSYILENTSMDTGVVTGSTMVYQVDESHKMYRYAGMNRQKTGMSLRDEELYIYQEDRLSVFSFHSFSELLQRARSILKGKTLSDGDLQKYFLTDE